MVWNLSAYLRSKWLCTSKRPKTVLRGQLYLELFEERNPPSSLIVSGPAGGSTSGASIGSAGTHLTVTPNTATASAATTSTGTSAANTTTTANTSTPSSANADGTSSISTSDPFADPLADPLGGKTSKAHAGGGSGSPSGGSSGGGGAGNGAGAAADSPATFTPPLASSGSSTDSLWQSLNTLGTSTTVAAASTASQPLNQGTTNTAPPVIPSLGNKYQVPLLYAPNVGQNADPSVRYLAQNSGFSAAFTDSGVTFQFARPDGSGATDTLQLHLDGANPHPTILAQNQSHVLNNYYLAGKSLTDITQYQTLVYQNVYQGIDLVFHSDANNQFEYDFRLQPGASLADVKLTWQGAQGLTTDAQGNLDIQTASGGTIVENAPALYQTTGVTKQAVTGGQVLLGNDQVGFTASGYDATKPLIVDPVLSFSSYLSMPPGSLGNAIAVSPDGNVAVTGSFPGAGGTDVYVMRFSPQGVPLFGGILTGASNESGNGVAFDSSENIYLTGTTSSTNFPTTTGAYETTAHFNAPLGLTSNAFVAKFSSTGDTLDYSSYVGSSSINVGSAIAVDSLGDAYLTGANYHPVFLFMPPPPPMVPPPPPVVIGSYENLAIVKLNAAGSATNYVTILGTSAGNSLGKGIAVDSSYSAYVTGVTGDGGFPVTAGVVQSSLAGTNNAVAVKLNSGGGTSYSTFLGGSSSDSGLGIAVDSSGDAYLAGSASSSNFPTTGGAYQTSSGGGTDAFITELNSTATSKVYSTYLGGSSTDAATSIAVDANGYATVGGYTSSSNLPTANALYGSNAGGQDGFVTRLNQAGTGLTFSSYFGGSGTDSITGVGLDALGNIYLEGSSNSSDLPLNGSVTFANPGGTGAFLASIQLQPPPPVFTGISPDTGISSSDQITNSTTISLSGTALASATVTLSRADLGVLPNPVTADSLGHWTYNYASSLAQGSYDFTATQYSASITSAPSADFPVTVDLTNPNITINLPAAPIVSVAPPVQVFASDNNPLPNGTTVTLNVTELSPSAGSLGSTTGTLTGGYASIPLSLPLGSGTYTVNATVADVAGNSTTSGTSTFSVTPVSTALTGSQVAVSDPFQGNALLQNGGISAISPLDFDQSPGTPAGGNPALVFSENAVSVKPIAQAVIQTDNTVALPASITATLAWDGVAQGATTFSTTGFHPGDQLVLAQQVSGDVTVTGRHYWSLGITLNYSTPITYTPAGSTYVVNEENSPYGAGVTLSGVDQLVPISADTVGNPAGLLLVYGSGGSRFFTQGAGASSTTFTSPLDSSTITAGGGVDTLVTAGAASTTFDASTGLQTQKKSADSQEVLSYSYSGGQLASVTAIDGALASFTYISGLLDHITAPDGTTSLSHSGTNLTQITNPDSGLHTFTYDGSHRLTGETYGTLHNAFAYGSNNEVATFTMSGQVNATLSPANAQGLTALIKAGSDSVPVGTLTDGDGNPTQYQLDGAGRTLVQQAADGGVTTYAYNAGGDPTTVTDPLSRTTTYGYDSSHYLTTTTNPDTTTRTNAYQVPFHALTAVTDENGHTTHYAYDGSGHQTSMTDALTHATNYGYNLSGELTSVTDPLSHTTTYAYDSDRRLTTTTDALGGVTTTIYDSHGNVATVTDALTHTTTMLNDALGRVTQTTDPVGDITQATYDAAGFQKTSTNGRGYETDTSYNGAGQVTANTVASNSSVASTTLTVYDNAGNVIQSRDGMNHWTDTGYDVVNRVASVTDVTKNATSHNYYDLAGNATATVNGLQYITDQSFDVRGRLISSTDMYSRTTTTAYDGVGNVTSVTDPLNHTTTTAYDALNRATLVTDADGHTTATTFDAAGNVSTTTDSDSNVTSYTYDALNRKTVVTVGVGTAAAATTTMAYDKAGNDTATTNPDNQTDTYAFDAANRMTLTVDALSLRTTIQRDQDGNATITVAPGNLTTTSVFNAQDQAVQVTDPANETSYTTDNADGEDAGDVDAAGAPSSRYYDENGRVTLSIDASGATTRSFYDLGGNLVLTLDGDNHPTFYFYDEDGRQIKTVDSFGKTTATGYDWASRVTQTIDADSNTITFGYDPAGRQTSVTDGKGKTSYSYVDGNGNVTATVDADTKRTTSTFDSQGRKTATTEPSGATAYTYYDAASRVTKTVDYVGNTTTFAFDSDGRQTSMTDGNGNHTFSYYDAAGDATQTVNGNSQSTTYAFDNAHREISRTDPLSHIWSTAYDKDGRVTLTTDPLSHTNATGYDGDGRVTSQTDGNGHTTTTKFDGNGQTLSVTDPNSNTTTYQYDSNNRLTLTTAPTGALTTMTYDDAGNVATMIDGDGRTTTYAYDANNREIGETWKDSGGTTTDTLAFTYDDAGHMLSAQNGTGTVSLAYNDNGLASSQTDVFGLTTGYSYDGNRRVTQRTDSLGGTSNSSFDGNGNLTSEQFSGTGLTPVRADLAYTPDNQLSSITRYNSLTAIPANVVGTTVYGYDNADRVTAITTKNSTSTTLAYYNYSYDNANRETVLTTQSGGAETFTYDSANQLLTDHLNGSPTTTYSYDNNGNRNMAGYTTGTDNQMSNDGTYTYTYDSVGNTTQKSKGSGLETWYYTYNQKNQITSIRDTSDGSTNVSLNTFTYDALNRRVEQDTWQSGVGSSTTRMANDVNGTVWADVNGSNALQVRYIMGAGPQQYFARIDGSGNAFWLVQDTQSTVRDVLNGSGAVVDTIAYTAYGNIVSQTNSANSGVILYAAYRYIVTANVDLAGARVYDPVSGKWLEKDPIGFAGGLSNLSDYVGDNPTNGTDPSGRVVIFVHGVASRGDFADGQFATLYSQWKLDGNKPQIGLLLRWGTAPDDPTKEPSILEAFGSTAGATKDKRGANARAVVDLVTLVAALQKAFPDEPINIIAHSEGTVITVAALQKLDKPVNEVILLNSPLKVDKDSAQLEFEENKAVDYANHITMVYSKKDKPVRLVNGRTLLKDNTPLDLSSLGDKNQQKFKQVDVTDIAEDHSGEKSSYTKEFGSSYARLVQYTAAKDKQVDLLDSAKNRDKLAEILGRFRNVSLVTPRDLPKEEVPEPKKILTR